jgi:hypothetical protein
MRGPEWVIFAVVAAGLGIVVLPVVIGAYRRLRAPRSVVCPQTGGIAGVGLDAIRAAAGAAFDRLPLKISSCTLWPERESCGRACLSDIALEESRGTAAKVIRAR